MKTNQFSLLATLCLAAFAFHNCSSDDSSAPIQTQKALNLESSYTVDRSKLLFIKPDLASFSTPTVSWKVIKFNDFKKDSLISLNKQLDFITLHNGKYTIEIEAKDNKKTVNEQFDIVVNKEANNYSTKITKVFEFLPSYGQFVNEMPLYEVGDTQETMTKKAETDLLKGKLISLGAFGGSVTFGFDHTIVNVPGKRDFRILANAFDNNAEPAIIMVAYDKNQNGRPDADEWYEIEGSEHKNPKTIKNYEITFYKPSADLDAETGNIDEYIAYTNNQGEEGYKAKNMFHNQSYYPQWIDAASITFKGTRLPNNAIDSNGQGNNWKLPAFEYGYADNHPNTHLESTFDIDWAIDKDGNKANLPGIDFIRVYNAMDQEAGWLGETSTEILGAIDLHL